MGTHVFYDDVRYIIGYAIFVYVLNLILRYLVLVHMIKLASTVTILVINNNYFYKIR